MKVHTCGFNIDAIACIFSNTGDEEMMTAPLADGLKIRENNNLITFSERFTFIVKDR